MRRAYVGMSSDKEGEKPSRRKPKVSQGRIILLWVSRPLSGARKGYTMGSRLIFLHH